MRPLLHTPTYLVAACLVALPGCYNDMYTCDPGDPGSQRRCEMQDDPSAQPRGPVMSTSSPGPAAVVTGVAAAGWAAEGCTVNGCEAPLVCDPETKRCRRPGCTADADCAEGFRCDEQTGQCQ